MTEIPICFKETSVSTLRKGRKEFCLIFHCFQAGWFWERLRGLLSGNVTYFCYGKGKNLQESSGIVMKQVQVDEGWSNE